MTNGNGNEGRMTSLDTDQIANYDRMSHLYTAEISVMFDKAQAESPYVRENLEEFSTRIGYLQGVVCLLTDFLRGRPTEGPEAERRHTEDMEEETRKARERL